METISRYTEKYLLDEYIEEYQLKSSLDGTILTIENGEQFQLDLPKYDPLIFGKDLTERIVSIEYEEGVLSLYKQDLDGKIIIDNQRFFPWLIQTRRNERSKRLDGQQPYKWYEEFQNHEDYERVKIYNYQKKIETYTLSNFKEMAMVKTGITYFKGMQPNEVSVLSFDIETSTLNPTHKNARIYLISNIYRNGKDIENQLFSLDDFDSEGEMIEAWEQWFREKNPSIVVGHNIYMFDLPYLNTRCEDLNQHSLELGRDGSKIKFQNKTSKIRKDGSQSYDYHKVHIRGREIIDTWFLALKYDIGRAYPSYGLKQIIHYEYEKILDEKAPTVFQQSLIDLQTKRQFYEASKIKDNWNNLIEREKIKEYCRQDAQEALYLYDLMIPAFFYMAQSMPKPFQLINESAAGSILNSFMVRSYLQINHSLPMISEQSEFEGAISFGIPGIYANAFKLDIASLYPSIIIQYEIYDKEKDPFGHLLIACKYFTKERLKNKKIAKETGSEYHEAISNTMKQAVNAMYGFLAAKVLFNSPKLAALITQKGREILEQTILWATNRNFNSWKESLEEEKDEL